MVANAATAAAKPRGARARVCNPPRDRDRRAADRRHGPSSFTPCKLIASSHCRVSWYAPALRPAAISTAIKRQTGAPSAWSSWHDHDAVLRLRRLHAGIGDRFSCRLGHVEDRVGYLAGRNRVGEEGSRRNRHQLQVKIGGVVPGDVVAALHPERLTRLPPAGDIRAESHAVVPDLLN